MCTLRFVALSLILCLSFSQVTGESDILKENLHDFLNFNTVSHDPLRPLTYGEVLRDANRKLTDFAPSGSSSWGPESSSNHSHVDRRKLSESLSHIQGVFSALSSSGPDVVKLAREMTREMTGGQDELDLGRDFETCATDFNTMLAGITANVDWAVKMFDAWGKPGPGITQGSLAFLGQFDECLETVVTGVQFESQHCIQYMGFTKIGPLSFPQPLSMVLGTCVPSSCNAQNLSAVINIILYTQPNITGGSGGGQCYDPDLPLSGKAVAVICVCSVFAALLVVASLYDILVVPSAIQLDLPGSKVKDAERLAQLDQSQSESQPLLSAQVTRKDFQPNMAERALLCFSVYTNGAKLLSTKTGPGSIDCIHGIRFLSMSWVILGHSFVMGLQVTDNIQNFIKVGYTRWTFQAILNATVSVDTFFTLSGLLMVYLVMKELRKKPPTGSFFLNFYFHRFWRLTPPYMLVLMVYVSLFHYTGDGPIWPQKSIEPDECEGNWWANLLYINNLHNFGGQSECMGWSWYLANDMQFYIISPAIFLIMHYYGWWGLVLPSVLTIASAITAGVLSSHYDLAADIQLLEPGEHGDNFDIYYVKPYCRIGPYLVGMITGYILYRTECKVYMNKLTNCVGWAVAAAVALAVVYGLFESTNGHPISTDVGALYNALARTAWGASVSWVIFACATGYGGFVNTLLSWKGLVPLSRLTYCTYLVHILVLYYFYFSQRSFFFLDSTNVVFLFIGTLGLAMMVAFVTSMAFEAPFMGLEKILLGGVRSGVSRISQQRSQSRSNV